MGCHRKIQCTMELSVSVSHIQLIAKVQRRAPKRAIVTVGAFRNLDRNPPVNTTNTHR